MRKLFFYDVETTGVIYSENAIHQLSGMILIDDVIKEKFDFKIKPHEKAVINPDALAIGNVTMEMLTQYPPASEVYQKIIKMLSQYVDRYDCKDKFHLCGYNNAAFDNQFFRAFFLLNNDKYFGSWLWADTIDIMVLASNHLRDERSHLNNFQLKTVAAYLGIDVDEKNLHNALYDIELTIKIFNKINRKEIQ